MSRPAHLPFLAPALSLALLAASLGTPAAAQDSSSPTHIRALAVYEYLGTYQKPARSRLVPVAIWDGSQFQPASLYLADPTPISVEPQTLYELMHNGNGVGQIEVLEAEQLPTGWIGLGQYLPNPPAQPKLKIPANLTAQAKFASNKPHFAYKPPASTGVAGGKTTPSSSGPANDGSGAESGRPTLHQPTPASASPTLHRRSEAQQLSSRQSPARSGRPILTYNTHAARPVATLKHSTLTGLPPQMHQIVAISDPDGTSDHSYAWDWPTPSDKIAALHKLEVLALQYLTPPKPLATPAKSKPAAKSAPKAATPAQPAAAPPLTLTSQHFRAFQLDYGSGPVYVFSAQATAPDRTTTYITLIAQPDFAGGLIPLFKSITPANLLDYQPRMKLIDAVDATGSGRADLLFDLITRRARHFALFQVQNSQAEEVFHTGQQ